MSEMAYSDERAALEALMSRDGRPWTAIDRVTLATAISRLRRIVERIQAFTAAHKLTREDQIRYRAAVEFLEQRIAAAESIRGERFNRIDV